MADGDNRHYGCQKHLCKKAHRYNGWHQCSIFTQSSLNRYNGYWNHIYSFQDLLLYRQYGMICGRWLCMVHCECWSSIFDRISFHFWIRLFESRFLIVWYLSLPAHSGFASFTLSLSFCTVVTYFWSMLQSKENLCLFVSCFYFLGNPLTDGLTQCLLVHFFTSLYCIAESHKRVSMTTFGSRLSTCYKVLQKERLLTYGVYRPGQSRGISPLQGGRGRRSEGRRGLHLRKASSGLQGGLKEALKGLQGGLKGASPSQGFKAAWRGLQGSCKGAWRGLERGLHVRKALRRLEGGLKEASRRLEGGLKGASPSRALERTWRVLEAFRRWRGLRRAWRGLQEGLKGAWPSRGLEGGFKGAWSLQRWRVLRGGLKGAWSLHRSKEASRMPQGLYIRGLGMCKACTTSIPSRPNRRTSSWNLNSATWISSTFWKLEKTTSWRKSWRFWSLAKGPVKTRLRLCSGTTRGESTLGCVRWRLTVIFPWHVLQSQTGAMWCETLHGFWFASPDCKVATQKSNEHQTLWTVNTKHCEPWTENSAICSSDIAISNLTLSAEQDRLSGIGAGYTLVHPLSPIAPSISFPLRSACSATRPRHSIPKHFEHELH